MARLTHAKEMRQTEVVLSFLPKDRSPIRWADLEREAREYHMSPTTLSQKLAYLIKLGAVQREVDELKKPPVVTYHLAKGPQEQIIRLASRLNALLTQSKFERAVRWGVSEEIPLEKRPILQILIDVVEAASQTIFQIMDLPEEVRKVGYAAVLEDKEGEKYLHVDLEDKKDLDRLGYTGPDYVNFQFKSVLAKLKSEVEIAREEWEKLSPIEQAKRIMKACVEHAKDPESALKTVRLRPELIKPEDIAKYRVESMNNLAERFWEMLRDIPLETWDEEFWIIMREAKQLLAEKIEEEIAKTPSWLRSRKERLLRSFEDVEKKSSKK